MISVSYKIKNKWFYFFEVFSISYGNWKGNGSYRGVYVGGEDGGGFSFLKESFGYWLKIM